MRCGRRLASSSWLLSDLSFNFIAPSGDGHHINGAKVSSTHAANADRGFPSSDESAIAKAYCNQARFEIAKAAMQVLGALGWASGRNRGVECCMRRCRDWRIAGGSTEVLKNPIAEGVFERTFSQRP